MQGRCRGNDIAQLDVNPPKALPHQQHTTHHHHHHISRLTPPTPQTTQYPPYALSNMAPSSPDPLQDLDGPSIYHATPVAPRTIKRTSSVSLSPLKSSRKLSHTTVVNTPTRSPWRIHVYVEAERDDSGSENAHYSKRSRTTRTKTTKVPLRGLSPSPRGQEVAVARMRRKTTPVRRRGSAAATPGGPGKTPAKSAKGRKTVAPPLEEEEEEEIDFDEGIGSMIDGMSVLGDDEVALVEVRDCFTYIPFPPNYLTPRRLAPKPDRPRGKHPLNHAPKPHARPPARPPPSESQPSPPPRSSRPHLPLPSSKNPPTSPAPPPLPACSRQHHPGVAPARNQHPASRSATSPPPCPPPTTMTWRASQWLIPAASYPTS